jgi:hypothetical protein
MRSVLKAVQRTALVLSVITLAACGGGGSSRDELSAEDLATAKFQEVEAAAAEFAQADTKLCTGNDCDEPKPGGDIVGRDLVMAITDPTTVDSGQASLRIPAVAADVTLPDQIPPILPILEETGLATPAGTHDVGALALQPLKVKKSNPFLHDQQVKVLAVFPSKPGVTFEGSGTMIDSSWVLTAGHALFNDPNNPGNQTPGKPFKPEYASSVSVVPAYGSDEGLEPFGRYRAKQILIREAFKQNALNQHDTGWIHLKNSIGGFVGYHIPASSNCSNYLNGEWFTNGYPAQPQFSFPGFPPFNGKTQYTLGEYHMDKCNESSERVEANFAAYGGLSGSGATQFFSGADRVRAVLVASDRVSSTVFSKITPQVRNDTANMIKASIPATADLEPVHTRVASSSAGTPTLSPGSKQYLVSFIHNRSDTGNFTGSVDYEVYLSINAYISTSDKLLTKIQVPAQTIFPKQTVAHTPQITIPCRPQGVSSGTELFIGIRILNSDANLGNNRSMDDAVRPVRISGTPCLS